MSIREVRPNLHAPPPLLLIKTPGGWGGQQRPSLGSAVRTAVPGLGLRSRLRPEGSFPGQVATAQASPASVVKRA